MTKIIFIPIPVDINSINEHRYRLTVRVLVLFAEIWPADGILFCKYIKIFSWMSVSGPYYNPRPRQRIPRDLAMCVTPSGQFYCSMCNSGASDEADFRLHLESKQHKSKVSEQRYRSEMENLGYT